MKYLLLALTLVLSGCNPRIHVGLGDCYSWSFKSKTKVAYLALKVMREGTVVAEDGLTEVVYESVVTTMDEPPALIMLLRMKAGEMNSQLSKVHATKIDCSMFKGSKYE